MRFFSWLVKIAAVIAISGCMNPGPGVGNGSENALIKSEESFRGKVVEISNVASQLVGTAKSTFDEGSGQLAQTRILYGDVLGPGRGVVEKVSAAIRNSNPVPASEISADILALENNLAALRGYVEREATAAVPAVEVSQIANLALTFVKSAFEFYKMVGEGATQLRTAKADELKSSLVFKDWGEIQ